MTTKQKEDASKDSHSVAFVDLLDSGDIVCDIKTIIWDDGPELKLFILSWANRVCHFSRVTWELFVSS